MSDVVVHVSDPALTRAEAMAMALQKACKPEQRPYVLIDASRDHATQFIIETLADEALCLFDGQAFEDLSGYAPWLVPLTLEDDSVFTWFMDTGWHKDWGIFLIAGMQPAKVKTSLKRSLRVQTEDNQELFFKFYRPDVFNSYLPVLEPQQSAYVMRDLFQVWTEDKENPALVHRYAIREGTLRRADLMLNVVDEVEA